jgi:hypothetical protein
MAVATLDPVTGPVPRETFKDLVNLPFGEATKRIRKFDPMYGRQPGEKIPWTITCEVRRLEGRATVMASSEKEAGDLAQDLSSGDVDWDDYLEDLDILTVEPEKVLP